ncbi:MAG: hypothetical protein K2Q06_13095, partial [Parvularculaceae bacterium]|nr:hypothetical protein [Parvularculaceae bacterium]
GGFSINDGNGGNNYTVTTQTAAGTINPKALTVTANNASRLYGDANPAFTAAFAGFVAGETQATAMTGAPAFATPAVQSSNVGSYAITPSAGTLAANNGNYAFSFVNGTLGVTPAPLTVTADNKTKPQGDPNPPLTATITGLKLGDAPSVVSGLTLATTALLNSPTGSYPITSSGGTATNYTIAARVDGTLSVQASASAPPPNPDNILAQVTAPSAIVSNLNVEAALKVEPLVDFDLTISDDLRTGTEEETLSDDDRATLELLCIQKVTEACNRLVR